MKARQRLIFLMFQFTIIGLFASCVSIGQGYVQEDNKINYSDFAGEKITVQIHKVFGSWYHASLRINLDSDLLMEKFGHDEKWVNTDEYGVKYITIGAGPRNLLFGRTLKAELNRSRDIDETTHIKVETHDFYVTTEDINNIFNAFNIYNNDLRYAYLPDNRNGRFNSNSFIAGLLNSIGLEAPEFNEKYRIPGYNKPIPLGIN